MHKHTHTHSLSLSSLPTHRRAQHLRGQTTKQPRLIRLRHLLKNRIHALPLGIPDAAQPIPSHRARDHAREVGDYEPHGAAGQPAHDGPELARGTGVLVRHALLPQHLLEDAAELLVAEAVVGFLRGAGGLGRAAAAEAEGAPGERAEVEAPSCACACACVRRGDVVLPLRIWGCRAARPRVVRARGVVLAAAGWVRERVVRVVDGLEALRAGAALGGVCGDAVRVVFQGGFLVGVADLLLGCFGVDGEGGVVVLCWEALVGGELGGGTGGITHSGRLGLGVEGGLR